MKSLAERHADRAQRKADNQAESQLVNTGTNGTLGHVANLINETREALSKLTPEEREELSGQFQNGFDVEGDAADDVLGGDGLAMAGIGVVNTKIVPPELALRASGSAALSGELPEPSFDPANGNLNGQAIDAAAKAAGWGTPSSDDDDGSGDDGYRALSVSELKAKLDAAGVSYTSSVNKDGLVDLLRANDAKTGQDAS